jgi:hypothetical protein
MLLWCLQLTPAHSLRFLVHLHVTNPTMHLGSSLALRKHGLRMCQKSSYVVIMAAKCS